MSSESAIRDMLDEAAALTECARLVGSISDQVASLARNVHTMGECADSTVALLRNWTALFLKPAESQEKKSSAGRRTVTICDEAKQKPVTRASAKTSNDKTTPSRITRKRKSVGPDSVNRKRMR